jgi:hypothetical protein
MQEDSKIEEYIILDDAKTEKREGWKDKFWDFIGGRYFVPVAVILIAIVAFCLGRISGLQDKREPVRILNNTPLTNGEVKGASTDNSPPNPSLKLREGSSAPSESGGQVVASKNGTKYHYPWCAGAKQISAQNLITFDSIEKARAAGYTPATNCKGLK